MDERKVRLLMAIVENYIATAQPVGSRLIADTAQLSVSSATIRNEMADLTQAGYLSQPHVSAGRVPTLLAYRLYVDELLSRGVIEHENRALSGDNIDTVLRLEEVVYTTAQALSHLTGHVSLVMMPKMGELSLKALQLVPLGRSQALLVLVTDSGVVRDSVVRVSGYLDADQLHTISRLLTEKLKGHSLDEVKRLLTQLAAQNAAEPLVMQGIVSLAEQMQQQVANDQLTVCGTHHILNFKEYDRLPGARTMLSALEAKDGLLDLIREYTDRDITVLMGAQLRLPGLRDCALVLKSYAASGGHRGVLGVMGPARMPYDNILSTLHTVGRRLSNRLVREEKP